jgi:quinohemoprotein ethanol dehydrogenase
MEKPVHRAFQQIVREGLFLPNGMPRFDDLLSAEQAKAIHAFLIDEQGKVRARELQLQREGKPLDSRSLTILSNF